MPIKSDVHMEKVPLNGMDLQKEINKICKIQAGSSHPRRLVAAFPVSEGDEIKIILIFELAG